MNIADATIEELEAEIERRRTQTMFDFGQGSVPAHRHQNPDGTEGGWVAETAAVASTVHIERNALVFGTARVCGDAWVFGTARVYGDAWVCGDALVCGNAWVFGAHLDRGLVS